MEIHHQPKQNLHLSSKLKRARELRGWSCEYVREHIGAPDEKTIRRWEHGTHRPSPYYRQRLCELFSMNAEELGLLPTSSPEQIPSGEEPSRQQQPIDLVERQRLRNRQRLLAKVYAFWIEGVLERSLHGAALLALEIEELPAALANPWHLVIQRADLPASPLPPGTSIESTYDQAQGELLLLGEPGSGKTTLLLELTRILLKRATDDPHYPLPIVFHLSSWAVTQKPLADWLVDELHEKYQVPRPLGQAWVDANEILPLLDGLDEVIPFAQTACVEIINAFLSTHATSVVVCSRRADYFAQTGRLVLQTAVMIQPLTLEQIERYFEQGGEKLMAVQATLREDPVLQELVQTPLMLNILALAYQGRPVGDLLAAASLDTQRHQLFATYIKRTLQRRSLSSNYTYQQTMQWLAWLARRLKQRGQTVFYLEQMQSDWLSSEWSRRIYEGLMEKIRPGLVTGLFTGLLIGMAYTQIFDSLAAGIHVAFINILAFGLFGGPVIGLLGELSDTLFRRWIGRRASGILSGLISGLAGSVLLGLLVTFLGKLFLLPMWEVLNGMLCGLTGGLTIGVLDGLERSMPLTGRVHGFWSHLGQSVVKGLLIGLCIRGGIWLFWSKGIFLSEVSVTTYEVILLFYTVFGCLIGALVAGFSPRTTHGIELVEAVKWSWMGAWKGLVKGGLFGVLVIVLVGGFNALIQKFLLGAWNYTVLIGLFSLVFGGIFGGLTAGWSSTRLDDRLRITPNFGIQRSAWNSLRAAVLCGILSALATTCITVGLTLIYWAGDPGFVPELLLEIRTGLLVGGAIGLLVGSLWGGGIACLQHFVLRMLLVRAGSLPWKYPQFLNYATERILLRKVGGGYIFIHQLLQDYFIDPFSQYDEAEDHSRSGLSRW